MATLAQPGRRVIVVDGSNEIAGDTITPHPCIGSARRMTVPMGVLQRDIARQAVENHTPEASATHSACARLHIHADIPY